MTSAAQFVTRHSIAIYFVLTFAISWGGLFAVGGSGGPSGTAWQADPLLPLLVMAMLGGPSLAGLLMTGMVSGRDGLRELGARLLRWRVGAGWYAVALLTAPLVFTAVHLALSLVWPPLLPRIPDSGDARSFVFAALAGALVVGVFEELGWTGFAVPRLLQRHGTLGVGLIVGVPWGAWHFLTNNLWMANAFRGELPHALFLTLNGVGLLVGQLPAYRVLMVWVYERTGSLLVAMLMHVSLSACTFLVDVPATGWRFVAYVAAMGAAWWVAVAVVAGGQRAPFSRAPIQRAA